MMACLHIGAGVTSKAGFLDADAVRSELFAGVVGDFEGVGAVRIGGWASPFESVRSIVDHGAAT